MKPQVMGQGTTFWNNQSFFMSSIGHMMGCLKATTANLFDQQLKRKRKEIFYWYLEQERKFKISWYLLEIDSALQQVIRYLLVAVPGSFTKQIPNGIPSELIKLQ